MNLSEKLPKILAEKYEHHRNSALHIYFKYKGNEYICMDSGSNNPFYAPHIRAFEINGNDKTDVKCKFTGDLLRFAEYNSSIGEREFKNGSITYEYLFEPLGIEMDRLCYMIDLKKWLEKNNINYYQCRL